MWDDIATICAFTDALWIITASAWNVPAGAWDGIASAYDVWAVGATVCTAT